MMTSDDTHFLRVGLMSAFLVAIFTIVGMVALVSHGSAVPAESVGNVELSVQSPGSLQTVVLEENAVGAVRHNRIRW